MKTLLKNTTTDGLTLEEAMHLQAIEDNPLDEEQVEILRMFEREGWSEERQLAYMRRWTLERFGVPAAE
jgi:hypothetical protein